MSSKRQASSQCTEPSSTSKGYPASRAGHLVHPPPVEVDFQADDDGQPGILGLLGAAHVRIEVGRGVEIPVVGHRRLQRGGHPVVGPESPEQGLRLAETEEVLGDGQFLHPGRLGLLAVGLQLVEVQGRRTLVVRPQVEVVVEHRGTRCVSAGVADQRHAVSNGGQHADHPGVVDHLVVEGAQGRRPTRCGP